MERHDLLHEFPEYQERIHELKVSDVHFRKLFDEYHDLEHEIHRINTGVEVVSDDFAHEKKAQLLHIKDALLELLKQ
jgi:uncharacterized protein YdcH (DUF465 family)